MEAGLHLGSSGNFWDKIRKSLYVWMKDQREEKNLFLSMCMTQNTVKIICKYIIETTNQSKPIKFPVRKDW